MAKVSFDRFKDRLLRIEGGYQSDPTDSGNYTGCKVGSGSLVGTNNGISGCFYADKIKSNPTANDIKSITVNEAERIYEKYFWKYNQIDEFTNQAFAENVMDMVVNAGSGRGIKILQKTLNELGENLAVDGSMGAKTLASVNRQLKRSAPRLYNLYTTRRKGYYNSLTHKPAHQIASWNNRIENEFPPMGSFFDGAMDVVDNMSEMFPQPIATQPTIPEVVVQPVVVQQVNEPTTVSEKVNDELLYQADVILHSARAIPKVGQIDPIVFSKDLLRLIAIVLFIAVLILGGLAFSKELKNEER